MFQPTAPSWPQGRGVSVPECSSAPTRGGKAATRSTDAQSVRAGADERRYDNLAVTGAVAKRDADLYRAAAITAQSDAERSRAELSVSRDQTDVVHAKRATLVANVAQARA